MHDFFKFLLAVQEMISFNKFSIYSSGGHFILQSASVWALLVEGLMFGPAFQKISFKYLFLYLAPVAFFWRPAPLRQF